MLRAARPWWGDRTRDRPGGDHERDADRGAQPRRNRVIDVEEEQALPVYDVRSERGPLRLVDVAGVMTVGRRAAKRRGHFPLAGLEIRAGQRTEERRALAEQNAP